MAGERYSHSLDVGKELEKEKEEEKKGEQQPLPCFCSPKIRPKNSENGEEQEKKEEPAQEQEKGQEGSEESAAKEETSEQQASEKQEAAKESVPEQQPVQEISEQQAQPSIVVRPAELAEDSGWESMEDVVPAEPQSPPDPVEEDVNAIITKDIPVLHSRKGIVERLLEHKLLLLVGFVAVIAGIFFAWKMILPEPAVQQFELEPSAAFVPPNITLFHAQVPEAPVVSQEAPETGEVVELPEEGVVGEVVPAETIVQANVSSVDELPDFFVRQLKD